MSRFHLVQYDLLDSTNDTAKDHARKGKYDLAIIADRQQSGRGRSGNTWVSDLGNLYLSLILNENIPLRDAGQLSFLTAVALYNTLEKYTEKRLEQKWPNDLLLDHKKVSGILLESEADTNLTKWVVIGVGVNLVNAPDGATSLETNIKADKIATEFLDAFEKWLALWKADGFEVIRSEWLKNARGLGSEITVRLPRETKKGIFQEIDENGCLVLKQGDHLIKIASGDVFFE